MSRTAELNGTDVAVKSKMKFREVMMTPAWAEALLKRNHPKNRKVKWRKVEQYARDMKAGLWRTTHQGVALDEDDYLIDGQNRLIAVVESECTVPMLLISNAPNAGMVAVDHHAARSVADSAKIGGYKFDVPDTVWPTIARNMMIGTMGGSPVITHQEVIKFAKVHKKAIQFSVDVTPKNDRKTVGGISRAVIARAWYTCKDSPEDLERLTNFGRWLTDGMIKDRDTDQAVMRLRNWLDQLSGKGGAGTRKEIYCKTANALRYFLDKKPMEFLKAINEELFPIPGGDLTDEE